MTIDDPSANANSGGPFTTRQMLIGTVATVVALCTGAAAAIPVGLVALKDLGPTWAVAVGVTCWLLAAPAAWLITAGGLHVLLRSDKNMT